MPLRVAQVDCRHPAPLDSLTGDLGDGPFALVILFVSPQADFAAISRDAARRFGVADVVACTTAGEIGAQGYQDGQIIALGFPSHLFSASVLPIHNLTSLDDAAIFDKVIRRRLQLLQDAPDMAHEFAFLVVDGLSLSEEHLTDVLASGLGPMPLFGGSSGDGTEFQQTWVSLNGQILANAAVLSMIRSHCEARVFSLNHLTPGDQRFVVTAADPAARIVREINAEPAAKEYARLLGKDPNQLDPFTFAAHPVVVRVGDTHHVRAIQKVNDQGELVFFSAINEGMVLSLADHQDMVQHLDQTLQAMSQPGRPHQILASDCMLRRIEASQNQQIRALSDVMVRHRVVGFSTYGEQYGALHVNQTLTGVLLRLPEPKGPGAT